jgi:predicted glycoside hydrolase/deacetylase ChbG (UPF0249 family)
MKNIILLVFCLGFMVQLQAQTLAEKLGYPAGTKLLIVNADDAGMCHAANLAVMEGLKKGGLSSATIMVPCPWFSEIADFAEKNPEADFGIHLTHTSEWKFYRWGPVASSDKVSGLLDQEGFLWRSVQEVYQHGSPEQALTEGRAQIRKAMDAGVPVTHLDSHMGTLQLHPDYVAVYLQLAREFDLPVRMASQSTLADKGFPQLRQRFAGEGILFPDYFIYDEMQSYKEVKPFWTRIIKELKAGVTELFIHPALPNEELKAVTNSWKTRGEEYELFVNDPEFKKLLADEKVKLIGWKAILDLQRKE